MDPNTEKLIRELAEKLGTTAENLWGVLIKQAEVEAYSTIWGFAICGGIFIILFLLGLIISDPKDKDDFGVHLAGISLIAIGIIFVSGLCSYKEVITQLKNPEFWALSQVLKQMR